MIILAILAIGAGIFNNIQDNQLKVVYDKGKLDWTISPLEVTKNDTIRIVVNNLGDISYPFPSGKIWTIIDQDQNEMKTANGPLTVNYNYTWLVKPCDFKDKGEKGIYLVKPEIWGKPLPINITVSNPIATGKTSV